MYKKCFSSSSKTFLHEVGVYLEKSYISRSNAILKECITCSSKTFYFKLALTPKKDLSHGVRLFIKSASLSLVHHVGVDPQKNSLRRYYIKCFTQERRFYIKFALCYTLSVLNDFAYLSLDMSLIVLQYVWLDDLVNRSTLRLVRLYDPHF